MKPSVRSILIWLLGWPLAVTAEPTSLTEITQSPEHVEQRLALFRPGAATPINVPAIAPEKVRAIPSGGAVLYSRWAQLGEFDPAAVRPGDRLVIEISPGESLELVISRVEEVVGTGTRFFYGGFPDPGYPRNDLFLEFSGSGGASGKSAFQGGRLKITGQSRYIVFHAVPEVPGWSLIKEVKPEIDLRNDLDIVRKEEGKQ